MITTAIQGVVQPVTYDTTRTSTATIATAIAEIAIVRLLVARRSSTTITALTFAAYLRANRHTWGSNLKLSVMKTPSPALPSKPGDGIDAME
jgi:hypothetical protein